MVSEQIFKFEKIYTMKYTILIIISMILFSCEDVLIEKPKAIVAESFYNTPGELETAVNAIFSPLRSNNCFGALYTWQLEVYSDFQIGRGSYAVLNNYDGLDNTNINRIGQIWDQFFLAIRNANLVIENAPSATAASESDIARYIAEARFMRGLIYFYMIPNWGKLPIVTESNYKDLNIPLSSADEVYDLIIGDLRYAEQNLPNSPSVPGRPTKWSAKSVLSHVHFTRGNYKNAMESSNEVINSGEFSLVRVDAVEDFQNLYGPKLVTTSEEIFYIKYNNESGWWYPVFMHHPSDPYFTGNGLFALYMDTVLLQNRWNEWDGMDLRKSLYYPWEFGLGEHTMLNNKFMDTEIINNAANDFPLYRYADILLIYAEAAARVNNSATPDGMEKLNMVHRRAYGENPLEPSKFDFQIEDYSDLSSFLDLILMERGYETYYEGGKRWLDLKRLGTEKARQVIKEATGKDISDRHFLWPFPTSEFDLNEAMDDSEQNPGY